MKFGVFVSFVLYQFLCLCSYLMKLSKAFISFHPFYFAAAHLIFRLKTFSKWLLKTFMAVPENVSHFASLPQGHRVKPEHRKSPGASGRYLENAEHGRQMKTQLRRTESFQSLRNAELWGRSHTTLFA